MPPEVAVLGCGRIAAVHARAARRAGPVALSFASRDPRRARAFADAHAGRAHSSYAAALEDPATDAVLVCTPPDSHSELALAALAAGRHVLVEKPAFMDTAELDHVAEAAESAGRRVLPAENYFFKPLRARLAGWAGSGAVGTPLSLSVDATRSEKFTGWRADPHVGGGPLLESGIHWIDLMANAGLQDAEVAGVVARDAGDRSLTVLLRYRGGAAGTLRLSWEGHARLGGARLSHLHGTDGTVTFESNGAFALLRGRRRALWAPDPRDASGFVPMWRDFLGVLGGRREPAFPLAAARRDLALVEGIAAAARAGAAVPPGD